MKREELKALGLEEAAIDSIMALHGKDIEKFKTDVATAKAENDGLKTQLTEAGTTIESFKAMKPEELQAAANDWKTKAEQAAIDRDAAIAKFKFDAGLEKELKETYKVKDPRDVIPHLKADMLKLGDDGKFIGLKEQVDPLKTAKEYLFEDGAPTPKLVIGGKSAQSTTTLTMEQIKQMSTKDINANWTAVQETLSKGK